MTNDEYKRGAVPVSALVLLFLLLPSSPSHSAVWHVDDDNHTGVTDGSTTHPFTRVQDAVRTSARGDSVHVAAGTYNESITINNKRITLLGGFPGGTPQDYSGGAGGDFTTSDRSLYDSHVRAKRTDRAVALLIGGGAGRSVIKGMHFSGGLRGVEFERMVGVVIANNLIEDNGVTLASERGGGILFCCGRGYRIVNNIIRNNQAGLGGGLMAYEATDFLVKNNRIEYNESRWDHGGGLFIADSTGQIVGNRVVGNRVGDLLGYGWGGGMVLAGVGGDFLVQDNFVKGNYAYSIGGGIFVDEGAHAVLQNNLIVRNSVTEYGGAGVYVDGGGDGQPGDARSTAEIVNCTIAGNKGGWIGGNGVYAEHSDVVARNTVFWSNIGGDYGPDFFLLKDATLNVSYSLSKQRPGGAGSGNLRVDPLFANPAGNDYHLQSTGGRWDVAAGKWVVDPVHSPAIDAGDPADGFANEPSPDGGRVNMGYFGNTGQASKAAPGPMY